MSSNRRGGPAHHQHHHGGPAQQQHQPSIVTVSVAPQQQQQQQQPPPPGNGNRLPFANTGQGPPAPFQGKVSFSAAAASAASAPQNIPGLSNGNVVTGNTVGVGGGTPVVSVGAVMQQQQQYQQQPYPQQQSGSATARPYQQQQPQRFMGPGGGPGGGGGGQQGPRMQQQPQQQHMQQQQQPPRQMHPVAAAAQQQQQPIFAPAQQPVYNVFVQPGQQPLIYNMTPQFPSGPRGPAMPQHAQAQFAFNQALAQQQLHQLQQQQQQQILYPQPPNMYATPFNPTMYTAPPPPLSHPQQSVQQQQQPQGRPQPTPTPPGQQHNVHMGAMGMQPQQMQPAVVSNAHLLAATAAAGGQIQIPGASMTVPQQPVVPQQPLQKRKSAAIQIIDPNTNKSIFETDVKPVPEESTEAKKDDTTSSKSKPESELQPSQQPAPAATAPAAASAVAAAGPSVAEQFATMVAQAASEPSTEIHTVKNAGAATNKVSSDVPKTTPSAFAAPFTPKIHSEVAKSDHTEAKSSSSASNITAATTAAPPAVATATPTKAASEAVVSGAEPISPTPLPNDDDASLSDGKSKGKKKGVAARKAEINKKGNEKMGGTDMDLFTETTAAPKVETTAETATASSTPAVAAAPQPSKPLEKKEAPVSHASVPPSVAEQFAPTVTPRPHETNHVVRETPAVPAAATTPSILLNLPVDLPTRSSASDARAPVTEDEVSSSDENLSSAAEDKKDSAKLKYNYKEDQWSPINLEGKKQYDRDFLMQLQKDPLSQAKPLNLPNMEIIKDKIQSDRNKYNTIGKGTLDFMPSYVKPTLSKGGSGRDSGIPKKGSQNGGKKNDMGGRDGRDGGGGKKQMVLTLGLSIQEKVELHEAENAWKPNPIKKKGGVATAAAAENGETDPMAELSRKARAILNKLTPQKFDTLVERFNELAVDNEEKLRLCMELVFEKAVDEPGFSVAYAKMCEVLQKKQVVVTETQVPVNFRKLLITRCQQEFERDYLDGLDKAKYEKESAEATTEEKKKELRILFEDKERRARARSLGNIRFIGELYKLKMLTARIMHECVKKLLKCVDEESLECLCRLLSTVGKDLEVETNLKLQEMVGQPQNHGLSHFDLYFKEMTKIIDSKATSSRVRFMLQDLAELRRDNWKPRRDVAGPKTIDQIHKEAEREKTQQQLENLVAKGGPGGGGGGGRDRDRQGGRDGRDGRDGGGQDGRKRSSRGPQQSGAPGEEGWTSIPSRPRTNAPERIDASRLNSNVTGLLRKQQVDVETIQLGPGSKGSSTFSAWGKGSSGTRLSQTKEDQAKQSAQPAQANRFAAFASASQSGGGASVESQDGTDPRRGASRSVGIPGRGSRGPSTESERERAMAAVRSFNHPANGPAAGGRPSAAPAAGGSHPSSPTVAPKGNSPDVQRELLKGDANLDDDGLDALTKPLLEEFLHNCDEKEAIACICEKFHPNTIAKFVEVAINNVLERSAQSRQQVGVLLEHLVIKNVLLRDQYELGIRAVLDLSTDLVVDIPKMWDYLAELIAPILARGAMPMNFLLEAVNNSNLKDTPFASKFVASMLHVLSASLGHIKVGEMWRESKLEWSLFIPGDQVQEFIASNKLEFTQSSSYNGPTTEISNESIASNLRKLLDKTKNNEEIFDWVDTTMGPRSKEHTFIRILMETVAESAIKGAGNSQCELKRDLLTDRNPLFKRYLDGDVDREKQALYSLQHLMHRLEHPNKLLHQIFEALYDADVLSEEAFEAWEKCDDAAEQEGKGVAIKSTTQFFTWLREAEEEETENAEAN